MMVTDTRYSRWNWLLSIHPIILHPSARYPLVMLYASAVHHPLIILCSSYIHSLLVLHSSCSNLRSSSSHPLLIHQSNKSDRDDGAMRGDDDHAMRDDDDEDSKSNEVLESLQPTQADVQQSSSQPGT
jgi:hypothetical protein